MIRPSAPVTPPREFPHAGEAVARTDAWKLRLRARQALAHARGLCASAAIRHRKAFQLAYHLRLQELKMFYEQLPHRFLLIPISGGQQLQDNHTLQIKLDLLMYFSVLTAHGEIDLANAHSLEEALSELDAALPLLLDFTGVRYMDSTAVHVLLRTCDRYDTRHTPVALVADGVVERLCMLTGLQERLCLFADALVARRHVTAERPQTEETRR